MKPKDKFVVRNHIREQVDLQNPSRYFMFNSFKRFHP